MDRRRFVAVSSLAAAASLQSIAGAGENRAQEFYELRQYHLPTGAQKNATADFYKNAAIPALNRLGIQPVGVFETVYGPSQPTLYVLIPHPSLESLLTTPEKLAADAEYQKAGEAFLNAPFADPAYVRVESSLMRAFSHMPKIELPDFAAAKKSRIFELRTYESHSAKSGRKKIEMFNEGGEIAIFHKTGLNPVFFGETLVGPRMPNLTYMLCFENMEHRAKQWSGFGSDPDWKALSGKEEYKDTVSNITDYILRPTAFSQI